MAGRCVYLVGARRVGATEGTDHSGAPDDEHASVVRELAADCVDCSDSGRELHAAEPASAVPRVVQALRRLNLTKCEHLVASGEDVGLPAALYCAVNGLRTETSIITHGFVTLERDLLRAVAVYKYPRFLALSGAVARGLALSLCVPQGRIAVTGWGVDTDFFRPVAHYEPDLIVSAGTAARDYATLLRATEGLSVRVAIAADSAWRRQSTEVDRLPLRRHVHMASCGDIRRLRELYASAAVIVVPLHPAPYASGYAVMAEAMAMGKPLVATVTEAAPDWLEDGVTALCVPPYDHQAMRKAIVRLLRSRSDATALGSRARMLMCEQYTNAAVAHRIRGAIGLA